MSKFGGSYPPGVTESMLPGNSLEEQRAEAMAEKLTAILETIEGVDIDDETTEDATLELMKLLGDAYQEGYAMGISVESMNRDCEEANRHAEDIKHDRNL